MSEYSDWWRNSVSPCGKRRGTSFNRHPGRALDGSKAWVSWRDADGAMSVQVGRVGEIGQLGLVIIVDSAPPRGTEVELIIEMERPGGFASRLVGRGEVLRCIGIPGGPQSFAVEAFLQETPNSTECLYFIRRHSRVLSTNNSWREQ